MDKDDPTYQWEDRNDEINSFRYQTTANFDKEMVKVNYQVLDVDQDDNEDKGERESEDQEDEEDGFMFRPSIFSRSETWLQDATEDVFDLEKVPLGSLTENDVESMVGLMVAWSRKNSLEGALTVERLLKRVVDDMSAGNGNVFVSNRLYAVTINAWARSGEKGAAQRAQAIHDAMVQMYHQTGDSRLKPTRRSFNALLQAWVMSGESNAVTRGEQILNEMVEGWSTDQKSRPDPMTISLMLELYGNDGSSEALEKAERLFDSLETLEIKKNLYIYSALQNVYSKAEGINNANKTMELIERMLHDSDDKSIRPTVTNFNVVLSAYSRANETDSALHAINLLRKMEMPESDGGYEVAPDKISYFSTILTCTRHPNATVGANLAECMLTRMEERANAEARRREEVSSVAPPLVHMDTECFNVVLSALSKSSEQDAFSRILRIIKRMESPYTTQNIQPTLRSWNAAINALSRLRTMEAAQRAEKILNYMFQLYECGKLNEKPDEFAHASVLTAYQKLHVPEAAYRADKILLRMEDLYEKKILDYPPDVFHYTIVCSIWAMTGAKGGIRRCTEILSKATERYHQGFRKCKPTIRLYNSILDCYSRGAQPERAEQLLYHMLSLARKGDKDARPDCFSFDIVLNAFLRSGLKDAGRRAESVLERGLEFAEEEGGQMLDIRSFTAILGYYGQQRNVFDSPYRAESILNRLISLFQAGHKGLSPHISCFVNVMDAYAGQKNQNAGECAENLFRTMIKLKRDYGAKRIEINSGVVNAVLNAWEASATSENAGRRAERLLDLLEDNHDNGKVEMAPNFSSYNKVIATWSKSPAPDKADRALAILNRMKRRKEERKLFGKLPEYAYSLVINACAFSGAEDPDERFRIFQIARNVFNELIAESETDPDRSEPSPTTYGWYLQAIERGSIPADLKFQILQETFQRCCEKQRVNSFVWERLKSACNDDEFAQLMIPVNNIRRSFKRSNVQKSVNTKREVKLSDLPENWIWKGYKAVGTKTDDRKFVSKQRRKQPHTS
ncbi:PPR: pentatricopeptide repeat domain containing protein [Nitzschia inconspicua]|uniref:PPR: pentatricopeptide repeat domain containing protein n=1 Tax=Nitzschia inconspicua TaxID=303405 RepID=A0A9K3PN72_9STRA|nr:PPR: pentatricopeptide repeat domain containing protein [Nitzschia inconspicua]